MAIVRTKASQADTRIIKSFDDADRFVDKLLTGGEEDFRVPVEDAPDGQPLEGPAGRGPEVGNLHA